MASLRHSISLSGILIALSVAGCGPDVARTTRRDPPTPPASSEASQTPDATVQAPVLNEQIRLNQNNQALAAGNVVLKAPIDCQIEFDFDPKFKWDSVVMEVVRPDKRNPGQNRVVWTKFVGYRNKGESVSGSRNHWSFQKAQQSARPGQEEVVKLGCKDGPGTLQLTLIRYPATVEDSLEEHEFPDRFRHVIWQAEATLVSSAAK